LDFGFLVTRRFYELNANAFDVLKLKGVTGAGSADSGEKRADLYIILDDPSLGLKIRGMEVGKKSLKLELKLRVQTNIGGGERWIKVYKEKLKVALDPTDLKKAQTTFVDAVRNALTAAAAEHKGATDQTIENGFIRCANALPADPHNLKGIYVLLCL
jgi:hypothetical protein